MNANRSVSACARCRKQKLRCSGPAQIPCERCRKSRSECVFIAPKAARVASVSQPDEHSDRVAILEQRFQILETSLRSEIQDLRATIRKVSPSEVGQTPSNESRLRYSITHSPVTPRDQSATSKHIESTASFRQPLDHDVSMPSWDIVSHGITNEEEWSEYHTFFNTNCRNIIAFMDGETVPEQDIARQQPLLALTICVIASRAVCQEKYQTYLAKTDNLIKITFAGPSPNILWVKALMLLIAWTGRVRLWGYCASIAVELGLNTAAIQLGYGTVEVDEELVDRARTWFSLCCFDLVINVNRPFVINKMRDYLPYATKLLASSYRRPVDFRICAYIKGFTIAADVKGRFRFSDLLSSPLNTDAKEFLCSSNEALEQWFYDINNNLDPSFQTFNRQQDRNRFLIPYCFIRMYINAFAFHNLDATSDGDSAASDWGQLPFIQKAFDSAILLLQSQAESESYRKGLSYAMEYSGTTTYHAINFLLKCLSLNPQPSINHGTVFATLLEAARMFEEAGAVDAANDVRRERKRVAELTQTSLADDGGDNVIGGVGASDIGSFLDFATWNDEFPTIDMALRDA